MYRCNLKSSDSRDNQIGWLLERRCGNKLPAITTKKDNYNIVRLSSLNEVHLPIQWPNYQQTTDLK